MGDSTRCHTTRCHNIGSLFGNHAGIQGAVSPLVAGVAPNLAAIVCSHPFCLSRIPAISLRGVRQPNERNGPNVAGQPLAKRVPEMRAAQFLFARTCPIRPTCPTADDLRKLPRHPSFSCR